MIRRALRRLRFVPLLLVVACGGDGPSPTTPDDPTADPPEGVQEIPAPSLSVAATASMEPLVLTGIPGGRDDLVAEISAPGTSSADSVGDYLLPLVPLDGGGYRLWIPIHPVSITEGGGVDVRVRGDSTLVSAPAALTLDPLPAAPGAFAALVDSMQALLDLRFTALGTTRADVLAADWGALDPELVPFAVAQSALDDPANARDMRDLVAGSSDYLDFAGAAEIDLDLIDRLTAAGGALDAVSAALALERASAQAAPALSTMPGGPSAVVISTAADLDRAMEEAWEAAREIDPNSATGELLAGYGFALGAIGLVTGPGGAVVTAGLGAGLWAYQTYLEGKSKLLPREFVPGSLLFDVDIQSFEEDRPGPGSWSNVRVSAQSEGWNLDKTVVDALFTIAGGAGAYSSWVNRLEPAVQGIVRQASGFAASLGLSKLAGNSDGIIEIPSEVWTDIDITGEMWSEGRLGPGDAIELSAAQQYEPVRSGERLLTVSTSPTRFGDATPVLFRQPITVQQIGVSILAASTSVEPNEVVELQILVENALDTDLSWTLSDGASWFSEPTDLGGGTWSAQAQMPSDGNQFPVTVTFQSTATGGARSTPGAPPRRGTLRLTSATVIVDPPSAILQSGEPQQFSAVVLGADDQEVTWSAIGPSGDVPISGEGLFTAPDEQGDYLITATSVAEPSAEGFANVTVTGVCQWSLDIGGTSVSSTEAYHQFAGPMQVFQMSFGVDPSAGTLISPGPVSQATGSWQDVIFAFQSGNSSWSANGSDGTSATFLVTANDGDVVTGEVTGVALLAGLPGELVDFRLTFRSIDLFGASDCGG